jgi:hypothetical protein
VNSRDDERDLNHQSRPNEPSAVLQLIDHRFFGRVSIRQPCLALLYLVPVAVSIDELYSDERLGEFLEIRHSHELTGARDELVARDLIAFKDGVYQVLDLPAAPTDL